VTGTVFLHLAQGEGAATASVYALDGGRRYISLDLGGVLSVHLPDFDAVSVAYARAMAATLTKAADELEAALAAAPAADAPVPLTQTCVSCDAPAVRTDVDGHRRCASCGPRSAEAIAEDSPL
jgi:hypothetical protein